LPTQVGLDDRGFHADMVSASQECLGTRLLDRIEAIRRELEQLRTTVTTIEQ
jgi:hypothetical protein